MPLYDFRCTTCGNRFEQLVRSSDKPDALQCPACGKAKVERLLSAPARPAGTGEKGSSCAPRGGFT